MVPGPGRDQSAAGQLLALEVDLEEEAKTLRAAAVRFDQLIADITKKGATSESNEEPRRKKA